MTGRVLLHTKDANDGEEGAVRKGTTWRWGDCEKLSRYLVQVEPFLARDAAHGSVLREWHAKQWSALAGGRGFDLRFPSALAGGVPRGGGTGIEIGQGCGEGPRRVFD